MQEVILSHRESNKTFTPSIYGLRVTSWRWSAEEAQPNIRGSKVTASSLRRDADLTPKSRDGSPKLNQALSLTLRYVILYHFISPFSSQNHTSAPFATTLGLGQCSPIDGRARTLL